MRNGGSPRRTPHHKDDPFPHSSFSHRSSSLSVSDLRSRSPTKTFRSPPSSTSGIRSPPHPYHHDNRSDSSSRCSDPDRTLVDQTMRPNRSSTDHNRKQTLSSRFSGRSQDDLSGRTTGRSHEELRKQNSFDTRKTRHRLASDPDYIKEVKSRSYDNLFFSPASSTTSSSSRKCLTPRTDHVTRKSDHVTRTTTTSTRRESPPPRRPGSDGSDVFETSSTRHESISTRHDSAAARYDSSDARSSSARYDSSDARSSSARYDSDTRSVASERQTGAVMKPHMSPLLHRSSPRPTRTSPGLGNRRVSPKIGNRDPSSLSSFVYRPRPRSIATDIGYSKLYHHEHGPTSPEYETGYRSSTSNLLHNTNHQSTGRSGEPLSGDVRKWGSCSRLEYNGQPGSYGHYPVPGHERTEGDGGPASYPEPGYQYTEGSYNPYNRRHSSSKMSSHSSNSDEVILAQKAELEEKNRVIESLKMRMNEADSKSTERAYSDKSGEHGAVAESLDSGIDIRSETGVMKPLFGGTGGRVDDRNELARLRLYVKQLEARVDSGVSSSYEDDAKLENLQKENKMLQEEKTSISRKFARLQDYLTTLPTVNEYSKLQEQLAQLTEENKNLQEEQTRVTESSKDSKQKDVDLKKYQKKCTEMRDSIQKLEKQNTLLKSQNANQAKQELQKVEQEKSKMEKKMEQLKKEIAVLSEQKESTKSLVGGYYEKFNNEQEKTKILTQSLDKSVTEVGDLKAELDRRSHQEQELQGRISDLERELEAAILKLEQFESKENRDVENSELLMAEYNAAFQDLNSVVEVCQMRAQGQQLDISLLLGLGSSPRPSSKEDLTVEAQLRNIHTLRSNIENIRTLLSDLYAEDIGSQCPTQ